MRMKSCQISKHPTFARYVRESMPTCSGVSRIMRGLKLYGSLDEVDAEKALRWGSGPLVVVTDLWDEEAWTAESNGRFDPGRPHEIQIAEHRVNQFETYGAGGTDNNSRGQAVYIVGATLLHEICHFGMHQKGLPERKEAGKAFERYVYGKQID
jgi:hypothetical protein